MKTALAFLLLLSASTFQAQKTTSSSADQIQEVIQQAYVQGIHIERDSVAVRAGFHPEFTMLIQSEKGLRKVSLDQWLERMKLDGTRNTADIQAKYTNIDTEGDAATARVEIYKDGKHIYSDFFALYRSTDGWKIVSKIFHSHK